MTGQGAPASHASYAEVAVPLPLPGPLTYSIPEAFVHQARLGARARVRVGKQRLVGVVVGLPDEPPEGVKLRPLESVVDREPVLPADLLDLARFTADYYRAPLGEVLRGLFPGDLPPWGHQKVRLTDAGALAPPRGDTEAAVVAILRDEGRMSAADLQARIGGPGVAATLDALAEAGRIRFEGRRGARGARYLSAVELAPGSVEEHLETAGRSAKGRAVVELMAAVGRPLRVSEVTDEIDCTPAVVRRLVQLGALRKFTQVERLDLGHHVLGRGAAGIGGSGGSGGIGGRREPIVLRGDQRVAAEALATAVGEGFAPFLLQGMTGSGKTEVYLRAAEVALAAERSVILMVPEIALVPALAREVGERFGDAVAILHSGLGASERHQEWERLRRGEARMVVGPRSALFAPVRDLGLLVVDEEQDPSYKQDSTPRYQGRDLALVRARRSGAVAVLVSATPSLESRRNVEVGKLSPLVLTARAGQGSLPEGILVDLRDEGVVRKPGEVVFSERLRQEIEATAAAGDQMILLRNRRGYAPSLLCRACGEDHRCRDCGLARTYHRRANVLLCHYCGERSLPPTECETCGEAALEPMGAGTERVEETFAELFPEIPVDVLDRDTLRRKGGVAAVLARFAVGETQALVGTQMVSKGHHFPNVALAAVLSADTYLGFADFRAVERTYTLLTQLAGRAGRGERPGRVVIQSYHPDHYAIQAALAHDDAAFAKEEMRFRRIFHYPPFTRLVQILVRDEDQERGERSIREITAGLERRIGETGVRLTGPAPAPFERLRGQWRFQLLLRHPSAQVLHDLLARAEPEKQGRSEVVVDVDPYDLL